MNGLMIVVASMVSAFLGALLVRTHADQFGLLDIPDDGSLHARPTPKGGGCGILAAFVVIARMAGVSPLVITACLCVAAISLWGDIRDPSPGVRLLVQFVCAVVALWGIGSEAAAPGGVSSPLVPVILIFVVGTANFYNFMDGIDGIAGITGLIAFSGLARHAFSLGRNDIGLACLALAGGCAGFLPMNVPRAHVFMGDVGSVFLGFCFALFVVVLSRDLSDFLVGCSLLFPVYADELCSMRNRVIRRKSLFEVHQTHLYQVLVTDCGLAHWKVALGYGGVQIVVFVLVMALSVLGTLAVVTGLVGLMTIWFVVDVRVKARIRENDLPNASVSNRKAGSH